MIIFLDQLRTRVQKFRFKESHHTTSSSCCAKFFASSSAKKKRNIIYIYIYIFIEHDFIHTRRFNYDSVRFGRARNRHYTCEYLDRCRCCAIRSIVCLGVSFHTVLETPRRELTLRKIEGTRRAQRFATSRYLAIKLRRNLARIDAHICGIYD